MVFHGVAGIYTWSISYDKGKHFISSYSTSFLCIRGDVHHSRYCTSEPIEHTFGNNRAICRDFTVLNFYELIEKQIRRLKLMYKDGFNPSRDPQKGYQATYNE